MMGSDCIDWNRKLIEPLGSKESGRGQTSGLMSRSTQDEKAVQLQLRQSAEVD